MAFTPRVSDKKKPGKKRKRDEDLSYNPDPDFSPTFHDTMLDAATRRKAQYPSDPDLVAVTSIDPNDVDQELVDIGANVAYWGMLHNRAKSGIRIARARREEVRGELAGEHRAATVRRRPDGGKPPTVAEIAAMVTSDSRFVRAEEALAKAEQDAADLETVVTAIKIKAEALRSLSANLRAEREIIKNSAGG